MMTALTQRLGRNDSDELQSASQYAGMARITAAKENAANSAIDETPPSGSSHHMIAHKP